MFPRVLPAPSISNVIPPIVPIADWGDQGAVFDPPLFGGSICCFVVLGYTEGWRKTERASRAGSPSHL
jgi:hypothetical protein